MKLCWHHIVQKHSMHICFGCGIFEEIMLPAQEQDYGCCPNHLGAVTLKLIVLELKKNQKLLFSVDSTE